MRFTGSVAAIPAIAAFCSVGFAADNTEFFEKRVRPVLATKCYSCHGPEMQSSALRLDGRERILAGGSKGPAAVAGKPDESLLIRAVRHQGLKMPVGGKLKADEIAALESWVRDGLPWPKEDAKPAARTGEPGFYEKLIREHWAFQPVRAGKPPATAGLAATANPVDRFIAAKLQQAKLRMAPGAEKRVLARRAAYVLTGLPPTPAELQSFLNDRSPNAYESFVDRLLASPQYGERWARHWMDLMRYAETYGYEWNYEVNGAWRYRDYLIRAFNNDLPYDQLVREHIAGDLLAKPRVRDGLNESVLGTMFFRLGEMGHDDCIEFRELRTDVVDNQIDTLTKAFQGLTVSCSRCHDHKIDPIPTEDYYALYGIINSSRPVTHTLNVRDPNEGRRAGLIDLKGKIRKELGSAWLQETAELGRYLRAALAWKRDAGDSVEVAKGLDAGRVNRWVALLTREKAELDDPLYPLMQSFEKPENWPTLVARYEKEGIEREKFNREKFVPFGDFRNEISPGWNADGLGLRAGHAASGDFGVAGEGNHAITGLFPRGLYSNLVSDRLNGVLRSPILPKDKKYLSLQITGDRLGAYRKIVDHCVIGEDNKLINSESMTWVKMTTQGGQTSSGLETVSKDLPIYLELATLADNPRFPERPDKFKGVTDETIRPGRSFFGITRAYLHDGEETPKAELGHMKRLLAGSADDLSDRFAESVQATVRAWIRGEASDDDVVWMGWLMRQGVLTNSRNLTPALRSLTEEYRAMEASLQQPDVAYGMGDYDRGWDAPIFVAGAATNPGRIAPRHFLKLMPASLRTVGTEQSGRREMAEAIASKENPLTARVMVNRVWHHVFGRGIVGTPDNFGRYGEAPTHPELLDYLSSRFVDDGWSMKKMVRLLVTSQTFQQSADSAPGAQEADPQNLLWHRYPVRRLDAESVRDSILAVSGRLDRTLYGPSLQPHRTEPQAYRRLYQGPLDGNGRRSLYVKITRMGGPRFLELFDFPIPMQTRGSRDVTNVPSQSLAMLNDPFVMDEARVWSERLVTRKDDALDARLALMFEEGLGRPPSKEEVARWHDLALALAEQHSVPVPEILGSAKVWKDLAHSFFCMKEFLYLR